MPVLFTVAVVGVGAALAAPFAFRLLRPAPASRS